MLKYIYWDLISVMRYLPCGLAIGAFLAAAWLTAAKVISAHRGMPSVKPVPGILFSIYLSVMLVITFLSRESGSGNGIDLKLFSTWGINARNNAFVVENVLLFIPYGVLGAWNFRWMNRFWSCLLAGILTSLCIEFLQFVTERGFFQIDDILTNTLGTVIGFILLRLLSLCRRKTDAPQQEKRLV